jgi:hypothetical protein
MPNHRFVSNILPKTQEASNNPAFDYEHMPVLTLGETVRKILHLVPGVLHYVSTAKEKCNRDSTLLTWDESAAIYFYTMPKDLSCCNFNVALRDANQHMLIP